MVTECKMEALQEIVYSLKLLRKIRQYVDTIYLGDLKIAQLRPHLRGDWSVLVNDINDILVVTGQLDRVSSWSIAIPLNLMLDIYYQFVKMIYPKRGVTSRDIGVTITTRISGTDILRGADCSTIFSVFNFAGISSSTETSVDESHHPPPPKRRKLTRINTSSELELFPDPPDNSK